MVKHRNKIVIINSFGPMGSSVLAALIEKFGFGNTPVRKLGLNEYLMGRIEFNSGYMQNRIQTIMENHQHLISIGGISVLDRDNSHEIKLIDEKKFEKLRSTFIKKQASSISDLFLSCRSFYDNCLTYKEPLNPPYQQIELTTSSQNYDPKLLYKAYREQFDEVFVISLTRNFDGWINALASQAMSHPKFKNKYLFSPHKQFALWQHYNTHAENAEGMIIPFESLFDNPLKKLVPKLSEFFGIPSPKIDYKAEQYDLYGRLKSFEETFTPFDDKIEFLSKHTQQKYVELFNNSKANFITSSYVRMLYLRDLYKFHRTLNTANHD